MRMHKKELVEFTPNNQKQAARQKRPRTLSEKVAAAVWVISYGVERTGTLDLMTLMWPVERFRLSDAKREAEVILSTSLGLLLQKLPAQDLDLILQAQVERMEVIESFLPELCSDSCHSQSE